MAAFDGSNTNSVRIEGESDLIASLQSLGDIGGKYLRGAIKKAMVPVEAALSANTPIGPTGNLRAAVGTKIKYYRNSQVAFGIVGYRRFVSNATADTRGYHSHLVEFGTGERRPTRGRVLSSAGIAEWRPAGWNGQWPMVARMVRGARAQHPLGRAFAATRGQALAIAVAEMKSGLEKAINESRRKGL